MGNDPLFVKILLPTLELFKTILAYQFALISVITGNLGPESKLAHKHDSLKREV